MFSEFWIAERNAEMGKKRGVERGSCGPKRITFFPPTPLFVLLSGFLNVSQSKSSRRKLDSTTLLQTEKREEDKGKKDKKSARKEKKGWG
jgi:hypothetical protein